MDDKTKAVDNEQTHDGRRQSGQDAVRPLHRRPMTATGERPPSRLARLDTSKKLLAPRTVSRYAPLPDIGQPFRGQQQPASVEASTTQHKPPAVSHAELQMPTADEVIAVKYQTHRFKIDVNMAWPLAMLLDRVYAEAAKSGVRVAAARPVFATPSVPVHTFEDLTLTLAACSIAPKSLLLLRDGDA
ncbi:hypothetical protein PTSG_07676 [Salpingoeca rosetta]|uniref:Uncharacterized protein n=1 Tax=Salpingoeca rosetta (strain ATCC 50818 / BSB-021) TaxID=946362 RepID=F2UHG2_SALR5|nr:uncharacterized protein PTSG_07676 [Salpingoeca rosetta]EGD76561.1 hypothetical protein PTSG_07676 [Salpingoeca rosetta]|eukprot:XP_004991475.1 hypothetical protein PTSG_07676 [Salpingoeca rosetta]